MAAPRLEFEPMSVSSVGQSQAQVAPRLDFGVPNPVAVNQATVGPKLDFGGSNPVSMKQANVGPKLDFGGSNLTFQNQANVGPKLDFGEPASQVPVFGFGSQRNPGGVRTAKDYQEHTHISHILAKPETYVGSKEAVERNEWLYDPVQKRMWKQVITTPVAMENLFKEIIDNPRDNVAYSLSVDVDPGDIKVWVDRNRVTIRNGGAPIPVDTDDKGRYTPNKIFGTLLTSSNYSDKARLGCGTNGYGAKVTNIYSTEFSIDIGDPIRGKRYQQTWRNNMSVAEPPIITPYNGPSYVQVSYILDFARFGISGYSDEAIFLFAAYAADASLNVKVPVFFNDVKIEMSKIKDYSRLCFGPDAEIVCHTQANPEKEKYLPLYEICFAHIPPDPNSGQEEMPEIIAFINGVRTRDGGGHVDAAYAFASKAILEVINQTKARKGKAKTKNNSKKKETESVKGPKLTLNDIRSHLSMVVLVWTIDPSFNAQTKTKTGKIKFEFTAPKNFTDAMLKWKMMDYLYAALEAKKFKSLTKTDGRKKRHLGLKKLDDAQLAATKRSSECSLYCVEGNSALSYPTKMRSLHENGRDTIGTLPLRGKLLDVMNATIEQIMNSEVINDLKDSLGLQEGMDYRDEANFKTLRYGHLIMLTDADDDGKHILGLIICYFHCRFPSLLCRGYVKYLMTPIVRIESKTGERFKFYTIKHFEDWYATKNKTLYGMPDYFKGLGTSNDADILDDCRDPKLVIFYYDPKAPDMIKLAFHEKLADARKEWIARYTGEEIKAPSPTQFQSISEFIDKVLILFSIADNIRSIPGFEDGLKQSQRQAVYAVLEKTKKWGYNDNVKPEAKMKVGRLATHIADKVKYHHGEKSMCDTIVHMAQRFVGSNNMPYFREDSQTGGTRNMGGKDAAEVRYTNTRPEWWLPHVFMKADAPLLKQRDVEGELGEFERMAPILPVQLFNGSRGIGTAYSTFVPPHNPLDVIDWYKRRLSGIDTNSIKPWYRGFKGEIEIIERKAATEENPERLSMVTRGIFNQTGKNIEITELPIQLWTKTYDNMLEEMITEKLITDKNNQSKDWNAHFFLIGYKDGTATYKKLHLEKSFGLTNIHFLMHNGKIKHFDTVDQFMEEWYQYRLPMYEKRRLYIIMSINVKIEKLTLRQKCIRLVNEGVVNIRNRKKNELIAEFATHGIPDDIVAKINLYHLSEDDIRELGQKIARHEAERKLYEDTLPQKMWLEDLDSFEKAYRRHYK